MSEVVETPSQHKDDPLRPYKAYASAVGAMAATLLTLGLGLPHWLVVILTVLAAGTGAFVIPNPKKRRKTPPNPPRNQAGPPRVI